MSSQTVPFLPNINLADGEQVLDRYGVIWEYDAATNTFINRGTTRAYPDVTEEVDGFVSPPLFRKLNLLKTLSEDGYDFSQFKIKTSAGLPYFYYLRSSNDLIRFIPESQQRLRIEVDRGRLYQKLVGVCCVGPKGRIGPAGAHGLPGTPAANELFYTPSRNGKTLTISVLVPTPLDTEVSVRFLNTLDSQVAEFIVPVNGGEITLSSTVEVVSNTLKVEAAESSASEVTAVTISGTVTFGVDPAGWRYKARQRGRRGLKGDDGKGFLEIVPQLLDDPSLISTQAVVSMRKAGESNIRTLTRELPTDVCVSSLASFASAIPEIDLIVTKLVSVEVTTRECKDIGFFNAAEVIPQSDLQPKAKAIVKVPQLELPTWTPAPGCGQRNRWASFQFNWWESAEIDTAFRVITTPKPPEQCCESDFFMCPNIGDVPCGVSSVEGGDPKLSMPDKYPGDCTCDCIDPIGDELRMGAYVFETMNLLTSSLNTEKFVPASIDSVVSGSTDVYHINAKFDAMSSIMIQVLPSPDVCGGTKERESCAFVNKLDVNISAEIIDTGGNTRIISAQSQNATAIPGAIDFHFEPLATGTESAVKIILSVNTTKLNYCRGYRVTVVAAQST
jgi:hypothetical protein